MLVSPRSPAGQQGGCSIQTQHPPSDDGLAGVMWLLAVQIAVTYLNACLQHEVAHHHRVKEQTGQTARCLSCVSCPSPSTA